MVNRQDYDPLAVKAAKAVLIELIHTLSEYKDHIVVVGGWVPSLLISSSPEEHVASTDVDLALNFKGISERGYQSIVEALSRAGYYQKEDKQPFQWFRKVEVPGEDPIEVQIDLVAGEYGGRSKSHRTQLVQDTRARKARGCDLAFDNIVKISVEGELPEGGLESTTMQVSGIVALLSMKGMVLKGRRKEKDAYDIYFAIKHYPGGISALIKEFRPFIQQGLVMEGLQKIRSGFFTVDHFGPKWVADFYEISDPEEREILRQEAFRIVTEFLNRLEVEPWKEGD